MKDTPGLVTCGDADQARYIISRNFAGLLWAGFKYRKGNPI
jgi:hypothetical protein